MKITMPKKGLKDALTAISKVVSGKSRLPIVNAVKISSDEDGIFVTGTNLEQVLACKVKHGKGGGAFVVDLKELKDYLKSGGNSGTVEFEDVGERISAIFHAGNIPCVKQFACFNLSEWPDLPEVRNRGYQSDGLFAAIANAAPSASRDEVRGILQSVMLEPEAVVATNGKELVRFNRMTGLEKPVAIPVTRFLASAVFKKSEGAIAVQEVEGTTFCELESANWRYTTKCIDGVYPDYKQVIPESGSGSINFSEEDVAYLKKTVPLLDSGDDFNTVHLYADQSAVKVFSAGFQGAHLTVNTPYKGRNCVALSVDRNLLLRALDLGFTRFELSEEDGIAPIMAKGGRGDIYVFMPLRGVNAERIREAAAKVAEVDVKSGKVVVNGKRGTDAPGAVDSGAPADKKEKKEMPNESEMEKGKGLKMVDGVSSDPYEEILELIAEARLRARELYNSYGVLTKSVKELQRREKAKEREFKSARELLGKLKMVSGF